MVGIYRCLNQETLDSHMAKDSKQDVGIGLGTLSGDNDGNLSFVLFQQPVKLNKVHVLHGVVGTDQEDRVLAFFTDDFPADRRC